MALQKHKFAIKIKDNLLILGAILLASILAYLTIIKPEKLQRNNNYIEGIPGGVYSFLNREDITTLEQSAFPVNRGSSPPKLAGTFRLNSLKLKFDKGNVLPVGWSFDPYRYTFSGQQDDGTIQVDILSEVPQDDTGKAENSYISGGNNCFTVYMDQKGVSKGCTYHMPALFSGCLSDTGIQNPQEIFLMKSKNCDDTVLMPINNIRINIEEDTLAEKFTITPTLTPTVTEQPTETPTPTP